MGDLTWLSSLGPDKLLALAIGMILVGLLVPRWVLKRQERAFDQLIEAYRVLAIAVDTQTDIMRQLWHTLEKLPLDGAVSTVPYPRGNGSSPYSGLDGSSRALSPEQQPHSQMHTPNGGDWTTYSSALEDH